MLGGRGYWDSRGATDGNGELLVGYRMSERWQVLAGAHWLNYTLEKDNLNIYSFEDGWGPMFAFKASF
ncbi:MAG: hypothetical protein JRC77_10535 [Deltaproteobacteria bacterium]|nr:hypothetical protein [Deltaproteobacteria bacterium]